jgi:hypothetical protein
MSAHLEVALLVLSVLASVLILFFLLLIFKLWRTLKQLSTSMEIINAALPGILNNIGDAAAHARLSFIQMSEAVGEVGRRVKSLPMLPGFLGLVQPSLMLKRAAGLLNIETVLALFKGVKVFWETWKKREEKNSCSEKPGTTNPSA